jgi:hypothetical protein
LPIAGAKNKGYGDVYAERKLKTVDASWNEIWCLYLRAVESVAAGLSGVVRCVKQKSLSLTAGISSLFE